MPQLLLAFAALIASTAPAWSFGPHAPGSTLYLREILACKEDSIKVVVASNDGSHSETREFLMKNGNLGGVRIKDDTSSESMEVSLQLVGSGQLGKASVVHSSCPVTPMMVSDPELYADWTQYSLACMRSRNGVAADSYNPPAQYYWH